MRLREAGFSIIELLIASSLALAVVGAALFTYSQGRATAIHVDSRATVHGNLRLAIDRVEHDLRAVGFGVPGGSRIGGNDVWSPVVFRASATDIGFRGDVDGGSAEIVCTPRMTNPDCPPGLLHLDPIDYYADLACARPDGLGGQLPLVAVVDGHGWFPLTCSAANSGTGELTTNNLPTDRFVGGRSLVYTIEQVYLRFVSGSAPHHGRIERAVVYGNTPDDTWPPTGVSWRTVATHVTGLLLEYRDGNDAVIGGSPLAAVDRARIRSVVVVLDGFDEPLDDGRSHNLEMRTRVALRNVP